MTNHQKRVENLLVALIATVGLGFAAVASSLVVLVDGDPTLAILPLIFPLGVILLRVVERDFGDLDEREEEFSRL